ncbi:MAG: hypothetical protein JXA66_04410, partial [Oligoflexia bacterium]|nr:hypothetical protein [Oligoflexia bacterium]
DRYGPPPEEIHNLLRVITIRLFIRPLGITSIKIGNNRLVYTFDNTTKILPEKIVGLVTQMPDKYKITPDIKLICKLDDNDWRNVIKEVEDFIYMTGTD